MNEEEEEEKKETPRKEQLNKIRRVTFDVKCMKLMIVMYDSIENIKQCNKVNVC